MSLSVFERPPLRLSVNIATPSGAHARWGTDEPDAANKPDGLSFGTSMPGGFADMSCTLARDPRRDWPDTEELSDVKVRDPGGEIAWEGRLEKLPDAGGNQAQFNPQAVGYQSHLDDDDSAREIYLDAGFGNWQGVSVQRQINLLTGGTNETDASASPDQSTGQPALVTTITGAWTGPTRSEGWYDAKSVSIGKLYYAWRSGVGVDASDPQWIWQTHLCDDDVNTAQDVSADLAAGLGTGKGSLAATTATRRFAFVHSGYGTTAGTDGFTYALYWTYLGVVGRHGCPIKGTLGQTGGIGLLASDVVAHAVGKWAPLLKFTTGANGTIQPSGYSIPQLAFIDPTTSSAIIKQAAQYELLDWAVWEGPTLYLNPRGESSETKNWRARIGPAQLQDTGADVSRTWNGVVVGYTGVDGIARTVGPPGSGSSIEDARLLDTDPANPANQVLLPNGQPLRKWAPAQGGITSPDGAIQIGQIFLQVQKIADTSGQAALVGYVQDDHGVWWPAWRVRAGDTITFTDAHNTNPRRVVSTDYNQSSKTNTVQLDQPPDIMSALLAEMSEQVAPFGLS